MVKHFAIATVSITALLALFATNADWGAQAQYEQVEANNRLAAAEAAKLGAKKIKPRLKIRNGSGSMGGGGDFGGGGGGGGSLYPEPPSNYAPAPQSAAAGQTEFGRNSGPGIAPPNQRPKKAQRREPTAEELEAMLEASRQRSGSTSTFD